jgi:hypothetical protein
MQDVITNYTALLDKIQKKYLEQIMILEGNEGDLLRSEFLNEQSFGSEFKVLFEKKFLKKRITYFSLIKLS